MGFSPENLALIFVAFILGGILKGATGAGAPVLAVPILALMVDVPFAVAVFLVPNLASNAWQIWRYYGELQDRRFAFGFALAGLVGAGIGTFALAGLNSAVLTTTIAVVVLLYVLFRLTNPGWALTKARADRLVLAIGSLGGFFQGAVGLSAPVSVTFMNAVGLPRAQFIINMSLFFFAMGLSQLPLQAALGIMTWERLGYSILAVVPLLMGMPIGDYLGRKVSKRSFDRLILAVLTLLALRLLASNFM